jgi:hypothetical protein
MEDAHRFSEGIIFLKIKIGWALPENWALDHRVDIRPLGTLQSSPSASGHWRV